MLELLWLVIVSQTFSHPTKWPKLTFCSWQKKKEDFLINYTLKHPSTKKPLLQRATGRSSLYSVPLYEIISKWKPFTLSEKTNRNVSRVGLDESPSTSEFVITAAESKEREREHSPFFFPLLREKNKSMNSSPASSVYHKQERIVINECPLLKLEQKHHIAENT